MIGIKAFCALLIALPLAVAGQSVSIPAIADAGLREFFATTPGGAETGFRVGNTGVGGGETRNRALILFDVARAVPPGAEITDVCLRLTVDRTNDTESRQFELRRVLVSWTESQVSWNQRSAAFAWTGPGGLEGSDFSATASGAAIVGGLGTYTWESTPAMTADARRWQTNASENFGWMLLVSPEGIGGTSRLFSSHENAIATPMLDVTYRPPFRIDFAGASSSNFCIRFTTTIGRIYVVERCDDITSGDWLMLTSFPPAKVKEQVSVYDAPGAPKRYYRVAESLPPGQ